MPVHDLPNRDGNCFTVFVCVLIVLVHDLPNRDGNDPGNLNQKEKFMVHDLPNRDGNGVLIMLHLSRKPGS